MGKRTICIGENKGTDQLRSNCEADQRPCFRYTDSTILPLLIAKISRLKLASVTGQTGLCWTWWGTQIVGFLTHRLNIKVISSVLSLKTESVEPPRGKTNNVVSE